MVCLAYETPGRIPVADPYGRVDFTTYSSQRTSQHKPAGVLSQKWPASLHGHAIGVQLLRIRRFQYSSLHTPAMPDVEADSGIQSDSFFDGRPQCGIPVDRGWNRARCDYATWFGLPLAAGSHSRSSIPRIVIRSAFTAHSDTRPAGARCCPIGRDMGTHGRLLFSPSLAAWFRKEKSHRCRSICNPLLYLLQ